MTFQSREATNLCLYFVTMEEDGGGGGGRGENPLPL